MDSENSIKGNCSGRRGGSVAPTLCDRPQNTLNPRLEERALSRVRLEPRYMGSSLNFRRSRRRTSPRTSRLQPPVHEVVQKFSAKPQVRLAPPPTIAGPGTWGRPRKLRLRSRCRLFSCLTEGVHSNPWALLNTIKKQCGCSLAGARAQRERPGRS
jgi:hypothetical protein